MVGLLSDKSLIQAISMGCDHVVCNEVMNNLSIPSTIKIHNAELNRIDGTWAAYAFNQNLIETLGNKIPQYFKVSGISIVPALPKILYWTNFKIGAFKIGFQKVKEPKKLIHDIEYIKANKGKEILKYVHFAFNNIINSIQKKQVVLSNRSIGKIGVLVNDEFEFKLYLGIISALKSEGLILFHFNNIDFSRHLNFDQNIQMFDLSKVHSFPKPTFVNVFNKSSEELFIINAVAKDWHTIASEIQQYRAIRTTGIKKLLVNVAENLPLRNLMKEVFDGQIEVYNTMNGMKSGEAHDGDVNFDKWFVWDEKMKNLLIQKCKVPAHKFIVSGHLSQDIISNYIYKNSLEIDLEKIKNKKVISLFSVRGHRKEKVDLFRIIYTFLSVHSDYYLIVKPHPSENRSDYIFSDKELSNVFFIPEERKNSKSVLYDLLLISDLSIVIGSTVALESDWLGVPCITYEYKETSFIYNLGDNNIVHLKTEEALNEYLQTFNYKKKKRLESKLSVAAIIANELKTN